MEQESSLPCSHDPATGPYVEAHILCFSFPQIFKNALKAPTCTCTYILMAETHSCSSITLFLRHSLVYANN